MKNGMNFGNQLHAIFKAISLACCGLYISNI